MKNILKVLIVQSQQNHGEFDLVGKRLILSSLMKLLHHVIGKFIAIIKKMAYSAGEWLRFDVHKSRPRTKRN